MEQEKDNGWREIWRVENAELWLDRYAQAWWNQDFNVCVLRIWYNWYEQGQNKPPTRDARCFPSYTEAIVWAQTRLQEMWDKWVAWDDEYEAKREQARTALEQKILGK